jgi:quinol monooxygenase YgiN
MEQFLAALRGVLPAARAEPTCIYLYAGQSVTDSNVFILSEGWGDLVEYRDVILHKPYFQASPDQRERLRQASRHTAACPGPDGFLTDELRGARRIHQEMMASPHLGESEPQ